MTAPILGIVGWSGSGKTSLLEALLPRLAARGMKVNVVKHSHHDVVLEPPGKDSSRLRDAGAAEVLLVSPYRYAVMHELREKLATGEQAEPPLSALLERLQPADLTLVEGYKWESIPKLEVYRPALGKPALYPDDTHVVAVASDVAGLDRLREGQLLLDLNQPEQVLQWLLQYIA